MSEETLSSRAPSLPMPTIQKSMAWPSASRGTPWRASARHGACASAASSVTSARVVMAAVTASSSARLFHVQHRQPLQHELRASGAAPRAARARPRAAPAACGCMAAASGTPGSSSGNSAAWRRRMRCTKRLCAASAAVAGAWATARGGALDSVVIGIPRVLGRAGAATWAARAAICLEAVAGSPA
jgi:hypothetical protein